MAVSQSEQLYQAKVNDFGLTLVGRCLCQAALDAALAGPQEAEEEEVVDQVESEDGESSDDAAFGLKMQMPTAAAATKAKEKVKPRPARLPAKQVPAPEVTPAKDGEKVEKAVETAAQCRQSLDALQPIQFWTGGIKTKDVATRLTKAVQAQTALEKFPLDARATAASKDLKIAVDRCNSWTNALEEVKPCRSSEPSKAAEVSEQTVQKLFQLPSDCVAALFMDIGRKMIEACPLKESRYSQPVLMMQ